MESVLIFILNLLRHKISTVRWIHVHFVLWFTNNVHWLFITIIFFIQKIGLILGVNSKLYIVCNHKLRAKWLSLYFLNARVLVYALVFSMRVGKGKVCRSVHLEVASARTRQCMFMILRDKGHNYDTYGKKCF